MRKLHIYIIPIVHLECYKTFYHSSTIKQPLSELIPDSVLQLIEAENENLQLTGRVIGWTV
ncbi:hypothetical protein CN558_09385 [Bacillus wiedmannii]|uniref:Uncharacterized protein n=1 Tax=Bacillus wiedmannii TaxID=1890302 RepID=A0A2B5K1L8_9BACI|nr:hypothetical protein [Bacillus wiedmannii]MCU5702885.1 hypothetical protein [Bacillus wiedmannii]PEI66543.1 hypothetical protein CN646_21475 [Bacillus wiedmannii]PEJ52515.1 hypothetical protein CN672_03210 [Bacillus wiedmannii]PEJ99281.1 hypothetical protein CN690_17190 [Bacillus wiedmannii]PEL19760.1 hypothetical protein CN599_07390 [Bacillus wiedmannii]